MRAFVSVAPAATVAPVESVAWQLRRSSPSSTATAPVLVRIVCAKLVFTLLKPAPVARSVPSFANDTGVPFEPFPSSWQLCPLAASILHSPRFVTEPPKPSVEFWLPDIVTAPSFTSAAEIVDDASESVAPAATRTDPHASVEPDTAFPFPERTTSAPAASPAQSVPPVIVSRPAIVPPSATRSVPPVTRSTVSQASVAIVRSPVVLV